MLSFIMVAMAIVSFLLHITPSYLLFPQLLNPFSSPPEPWFSLYKLLEQPIAIVIFIALAIIFYFWER